MSKKLFNVASMSLALMAAASLPLQAAAHELQAPSQGTGMTVVRDAETGKLRAPTAEEQGTMEAANAAKSRNFRVSPKPTMQRYHASGARGARLTDEFMSTSIALIKPDGSLEKQCFESSEAAVAAISAASTSATIKLETE